MPTNTVIDQYTLELERLSEYDDTQKPVRAMATCTTDSTKTAETQWSIAETKSNLLSLLRSPVDADWCWQQLEDHREVRLERFPFDARELFPLGLNPDDVEM